MKKHSRDLQIAGVKIRLASRQAMLPPDPTDAARLRRERFADFFVPFRGRPDIVIDITVAKTVRPPRGRQLFSTVHYLQREENWRMHSARGGFAYYCPLRQKHQTAFINKDFSRVRLTLEAKPDGQLLWTPADIIYDFLQVLLIAFLARKKTGFIAHAAGISYKGKGYLLAGKSGDGKSTMSRIWHKVRGARVINDDRVAIIFRGGRPWLYTCPWHGEIDNYLAGRELPVPLEKIIILGRSKKNRAVPCAGALAFTELYQRIFPSFWDRELLAAQSEMLARAAASVPVFFAFLEKNPKAAAFVRGL